MTTVSGKRTLRCAGLDCTQASQMLVEGSGEQVQHRGSYGDFKSTMQKDNPEIPNQRCAIMRHKFRRGGTRSSRTFHHGGTEGLLQRSSIVCYSLCLEP